VGFGGNLCGVGLGERRESTVDWSFRGGGSTGSKEGKRDRWRLREIFVLLGF
jgi:hypothetical protein